MIDKTKIRLRAAIIALAMSTSLALAEAPESYTAEIVTPVYEGELITVNCKQHEVVPNDSPCSISRYVISKEYGIEETEKYWPVFCFMNGYPRVIHPGEIVYYPESLKETESLYKELDESGWIKEYIAINGVYNEHDTNNKEFHRIDYSDKDVRIKGAFMTNWTIATFFDEIYGEGTSENENFIDAYLNAVNMSNYDKKLEHEINENFNNEVVFMLTEWIPTKSDLNEYGYNPKTK